MESETMLRTSNKNLSSHVSLLAALLALTGCNTGDGASGLNVGNQKAQEERVLVSDLTGFCPTVQLREGTAFFTTYEKGGDGDAARAIYQASISEVTRSCKRVDGMLTMNVAAAGKVVPGPKATGATVSLPIRVAITEGETVLYSQLQQFQVTIVAGQAATQFVFNDPGPSIPSASAKAVQVFIGFDEGPAPKKKKTVDGEG